MAKHGNGIPMGAGSLEHAMKSLKLHGGSPSGTVERYAANQILRQ